MTGRTDRLVLTAVEGGPDQLVSGRVDGIQLSLTLSRQASRPRRQPAGVRRRQFAALAVAGSQQAARVFGGPQDIEWAIDGERRRAPAEPPDHDAPAGRPSVKVPVLGPGPVAETLPGDARPRWSRPVGRPAARRHRRRTASLRHRLQSGDRPLADRDGRRWSGGRRPRVARRPPQAGPAAQARSSPGRPPARRVVARRSPPGAAAVARRRPAGGNRRAPCSTCRTSASSRTGIWSPCCGRRRAAPRQPPRLRGAGRHAGPQGVAGVATGAVAALHALADGRAGD